MLSKVTSFFTAASRSAKQRLPGFRPSVSASGFGGSAFYSLGNQPRIINSFASFFGVGIAKDFAFRPSKSHITRWALSDRLN